LPTAEESRPYSPTPGGKHPEQEETSRRLEEFAEPTGGFTWGDDLRRDFRFGLRSLRRAPGFAAVAIACLALGIGANAAIFSVVNAVLLRPLPYPASDRLVRVYESFSDRKYGSVSVPNYRDWLAQGDSFEQLAAWSVGGRNLQGQGEAEHLRVVEATPNLFSVLQAPPLLGRTFVPGQDEAGNARVAVLSESLWRRRFGADGSVLGRAIELDGSSYTVIGVMPSSFAFPPSWAKTDLWTCFQPSPQQASARGTHFLSVLGRLKPGVTLDRAGAQLLGVAAALEREYPEQQAGRSVVVQPLREAVVGRTKPMLLILLGAVVLVLLIACANVANLLLARAAVRGREVAIRLALGASRSRLIRQFLLESLVLALAGALVGSLLARWGLAILVPLAEGALPISGGIPMDGRVFAFLFGATLLSSVAFGIVPAFQASGEDIRDVLNNASGKATSGKRQQGFRNALVTLEIALSLVLLISAGLLMRGFLRVSATPPGLVARNVLTAHVTLTDAQAEGATPRLYRPLLERLRHLPGVRSAAVTSMLPIQSFGMNGNYVVEGHPAPKAGQEPLAEYRVASPQLFASLGIPILRGRDFEERDGGPGARWALINEALARQQFSGENPVGRRLRVEEEKTPHTILGVVGDVRAAGLDHEPAPEIYFPYGEAGAEGTLGDTALVIRTALPPANLAAAAREAVRSVDPGLPLHQIETMEEVISESLASRRLNLWLLGIFAGIALVLSAAGLYGVISYLVAQRTREIGVRLALGARTQDVVALVMRQGARLTLIGIALGLLGALLFTRVLESLIYGVSARDPLTFGAIAALLAVVALLATWIPAERAARVDPLVAIRQE
jgi:putative ABC transport system permease protein